jgi:hypothetical protein
MASLRAAVQQDAALQETVRSPLMLNVMRVAYSHVGRDQLTVAASSMSGSGELTASWRQHLFSNYIESMFRRRHADITYSRKQTTQWLSWLARKMSHHNQSVFYIERIQPSWLTSRRWRWLYLLISRLITGFIGGIVIWVALLLLRRVILDVPSELSAQVATLLRISISRAEPLSIIVGNMALALLVAVINGIYFERRRGPDYKGRWDARQDWQQVAVVGVTVGVLTMAVLSLFDEPLWALSWGIAEAVLFMVFSRLVHGQSFRTEVKTVEALRWSWRSAAKGLGFGLILTVAAEVIESLIYGYNGGIRTFLTLGMAGMLLNGLRGRRVEETTRPNQGIWLSVKNALLAALVMALSLGVLTRFLRDTPIALMTSLLMLLLAVPLYGGSNVSQHFLVRLFLWRKGHMPWNYIRFLDYSAGLVFLRKVGGGYMFIHHMLMEHFAGLEDV